MARTIWVMPTPFALDRFALDRRVRDENGHMHVANCVITRGIISEYLASEIPGALDHGFQPNQMIPLYRDPTELAKSLDSFKAIPLLRRHVMVSAEEPQKDDIVGVISNNRMDGADMRADVTLWVAEDGIDVVDSGEREQLSCGYGYEIDWTPGEAGGLRYVARMFNIKGNHCTLVPAGRVPGARVADQQPELVMSLKAKFPTLAAVLALCGLKPEQTSALDAALEADSKSAKEVEPPPPAVVVKEEVDPAVVAAQKAQDAATAKVALDAAVAVAAKNVHDLYAARQAVEEKVGVTSLDSAEATYRFALGKSGVEHKTVAADALPALWTASNKSADPATAQDSGAFDISEIFPGLSLIRKG